MVEEAPVAFSQTTLDERTAVAKITGIAAELRLSKAALAAEKAEVARLQQMLIPFLPAPSGPGCPIEKHYASAENAESKKRWVELAKRTRG